MVSKLLSLYVRAGAGIANLTIRTAARGGELAINILRIVLSSSENGSQTQAADVFEERPTPAAGVRREPTTYDYAPSAGADEPAVVDDERELVAEFAEPGAEDGASAELEVNEPWDGYGDMTAEQAISRIGEANAAELAVVELYERAHKQRRTVLAAAERRLKALDNAPS